MKVRSLCAIVSVAFVFCLQFSSPVRAQFVPTRAVLDVSFAPAMGGKVEVSLGNFSDEATCYYVLFNSKITVLGKVGTADAERKQFGAVRINPDGTFDSSFGVGGKEILSWGQSDYPNRLYMQADSNVLAVGASAESEVIGHDVPALFRISKSGAPDSTFGTNGRVFAGLNADTRGEFTNVFPEDTTFVACGSVAANNANGTNGFYAVRFRSNGLIDSTFGTQGRAFIPADVHSVNGFISQNAKILFTGVADIQGNSYVVLGRMTSNGLPDPSFGINGFKNTGIMLPTGSEIQSAQQQDFRFLITLPIVQSDQTRPITLARFTPDGTLDTAYGTHGYSIIPIEQIVTVRGINIANNGKTVVNGSATAPSGLEVSASTRVSQTGGPDSSFNLIGKATMDVDNNQYSNYLVQFSGIGLKRYMGFGGSVQNGKSKFLIARFKDDTLRSDVSTSAREEQDGWLYPNPAANRVWLSPTMAAANTVLIFDALGREVIAAQANVYDADRSIDISTLPNGTYAVVITNDGVRKIEKLIVDRQLR